MISDAIGHISGIGFSWLATRGVYFEPLALGLRSNELESEPCYLLLLLTVPINPIYTQMPLTILSPHLSTVPLVHSSCLLDCIQALSQFHLKSVVLQINQR